MNPSGTAPLVRIKADSAAAAHVQRLHSWLVRRAGPQRCPALWDAIQSKVLELPFPHRPSLFAHARRERLAARGPTQRFAVRPSSPDRYRAGASFAGAVAEAGCATNPLTEDLAEAVVDANRGLDDVGVAGIAICTN